MHIATNAHKLYRPQGNALDVFATKKRRTLTRGSPAENTSKYRMLEAYVFQNYPPKGCRVTGLIRFLPSLQIRYVVRSQGSMI